jgi:hypothetical protein
MASGFLSKSIDALKTLVAASSTFQTWVGAEDAAAAAAYVHLFTVGESAVRPCAVVLRGENQDVSFRRGRANGTLAVRFLGEDAPDDWETDSSDCVTFEDTIGAIVAEMEALEGTDGHLIVRDIAKAAGPAVTDEDEVGVRIDDEGDGATGRYWIYEFTVTWGLE